jgi:hypothetical protein
MSDPAATPNFAHSDYDSDCDSNVSLMSDSAGNLFPSPIARLAYPGRGIQTPPLARRMEEINSPGYLVLEKERKRLAVLNATTERELADFLRSGVTGTEALMQKSYLTKAKINVCLQNSARIELEIARAARLNPRAPFTAAVELQRVATSAALRDVSLSAIQILTDLEGLATSRLTEYDALTHEASGA